jgi:hypothetical protein
MQQYFTNNKDNRKVFDLFNIDRDIYKSKLYADDTETSDDDNKEEIAKNNKQKIIEKRKEEIAEKRKEKITCEICNCLIARSYLYAHRKTKKHLSNLKIE